MSLNRDPLNAVTAYVVLVFIAFAAIVVLLLLVHLIAVTKRKLTNKKQSLIALKGSNHQLVVSLIATIFGILCFEVAILLLIAVLIQLILIGAHELHLNNHAIDRIYYQSFDEMEYLIAIFSSFGHMTVVYLFINRFEYCFRDSHFQSSKSLIRFLYTILIALLVFAAFIFVLIIMEGSPQIILTFEVVWESIIQFMCLWLLYLFIAKLYELLTLTYSKTNLFRDLTHSLSANYKRKKERSKSSNSDSKQSEKKHKKKRMSKKKQSRNDNLTMTIDGVPTPPPPKRSSSPASPHRGNLSADDDEKHAHSDGEAHQDTEHETTITQHTHTNFNKRNSVTLQLEYDPNMVEQPIYTESNDLVNVMNKLTVLVLGIVLSSTISIIGNIFIEMHEMKTLHQRTADIAQMWAFLLPVFDMMVTALMLYLQFTFTHHIYVKLLGKVDMWLMKLVLKVIRYYWLKEKTKEEENDKYEKQTNKKPQSVAMERTIGTEVNLAAVTASDSVEILEQQEVP